MNSHRPTSIAGKPEAVGQDGGSGAIVPNALERGSKGSNASESGGRCDQGSQSRDQSMKGVPIKKVLGKIQKTISKARKSTRRLAIKAAQSVPGFSGLNPRRDLLSFRDHCHKIEAFPTGNPSGSNDWYLKIRSRETIGRRPSIGVSADDEARFREGALRFQHGDKFQIPEVFLACIANARIYSHNFLVMTHQHRLFRESAFSKDEVLETSGILDEIRRPPSRPMPGNYCLLASPWSDKYYYHWMIDALPRLSVLEQFEELRTLPLIVPGKLRPFHIESLQMAGVSPERLVTFDNGCWQVDNLYFPELLSSTGNPSPHAIAWLRDRYLKPSQIPNGIAGRRIYVTRRDAAQRRLLNESEIVGYLQGLGFDVICPADFPLADQIEIFRNAAVVVGPHGAGLTNMAFAPSNASLIELFGRNYVNGCFWALANTLGQHHSFVTGPTMGLDYSISLEELKVLINKLSLG